MSAQELEIWTRFAVAAVGGRCAASESDGVNGGSFSAWDNVAAAESASKIADAMLEQWRKRGEVKP